MWGVSTFLPAWLLRAVQVLRVGKHLISVVFPLQTVVGCLRGPVCSPGRQRALSEFWFYSSPFSFSLFPNAVLCQWCYLVSHTSKCWPRETWGSWNTEPLGLMLWTVHLKGFFPVSVWTLCRIVHEIPLRRARLLLGHLECSFWAAAFQNI